MKTWLSLKNNQGQAAFKIMNLITTSDFDALKMHWIYESTSYFKDAYYYGSTLMKSSWTEEINKHLQELWSSL